MPQEFPAVEQPLTPEEQARLEIDRADERSAIESILTFSNRPPEAADYVGNRLKQRIDREYEKDGTSDTLKRFKHRATAEDAWNERLRELQVEDRQEVEQQRHFVTPYNRGNGGHPANRNFTAAQKDNMNDKAWRDFKALEQEWTDASDADKRRIERQVAARKNSGD